ncbi:hypothetical protein HMPREF1556_01509 [Porphyromonas sp. oral taxon 278 str. W7784]|nr:hypothetical protein HMPREF1556_01509 [Porphyromonas sp. oral taxon 278 str. W7784]
MSATASGCSASPVVSQRPSAPKVAGGRCRFYPQIALGILYNKVGHPAHACLEE